ncbi:MAG TPA: NfeD family protein [Thermoanaerobaculia bacterium]|nr:NfeD family protein [Thermoanaerobaculia bacterium]
MAWWIWVLIGFLLLALELAATSFHIGFFAGGAFFVAALALFGWDGPLWQELLVFTVVSLIGFVFFRPFVARKLRLHETPAVDQLIGQQATAIDDIAVQARGNAELRGSTWSALNVGNTPLTRGQRCMVERVEGLLLHIRA